jgi:hypothetical protein
MKAIAARIRWLEQRKIRVDGDVTQSVAHLLRERRRRRLEASGQPFEEPPPLRVSLAPGKRLSIAETLRMRRQQAQECKGAALSEVRG